MPISNAELDAVVREWNKYAARSPRKISPADLLNKRDVNMYRGLGITQVSEMASAIVEHRSVATVEMTMGFLYERVLQRLGPQKVTVRQKQQAGYKGIDFVQHTPGTTTLVNLKAGLSTSNGDITESTTRHLKAAKKYWESYDATDDNPLAQQVAGTPAVVMVRAVARGNPKHDTTGEGILWLVGQSLWEYFGAGPDFLPRLSDALGRNPLIYGRYQQEKQLASGRVEDHIKLLGLADSKGVLDWGAMATKFP